MPAPERFKIPGNSSTLSPPTGRTHRPRPPSPGHTTTGPAISSFSFARPAQHERSPSRPSIFDSQQRSRNPSHSSTISETSDGGVKILRIEGNSLDSSVLRSAGNVFKSLFSGMPSWWKRLGEDILETAIEVKGDTMDFYRTAICEVSIGTKVLCSECAKLRLNDCIPDGEARPDSATYEYLRPLERIILQRDMCLFCNTLYEALCIKENDPLKAKHIQEHIQNGLRDKSFREWTNDTHLWKRVIKSGSVWPFGHSKDAIDDSEEILQILGSGSTTGKREQATTSLNIPQGPRSLDAAPEAMLVGGMVALKGAKIGGANISKRDRDIIEMADAAVVAAILSAAKRSKSLPCWVLIKLHTNKSTKSGLLRVHVFARNRQPRSALKEISTFHLRVASPPKFPSPGQSLRYGNVLEDRIDLQLSRFWLGVCKRHHLGCRSRAGVRINKFRVIDVQNYCLQDCSSLVEYAALSYVWGGFEYPMLTKRTMAQYYSKGGLKRENGPLPRSIVDAMAVTSGSGLRYLFVDSLCILQDSPTDLEVQLGQMDKLYSQATFTIVAADGMDANSNLKGVHTTRKVDQFIVEGIQPGIRILIPLRENANLEPWETRAWTLQEKMLSNRLVVFSGGHMMWHCREAVHYEDMTAVDAKAIIGSDRASPLLATSFRDGDLASAAPLSYSSHSGNVSVMRSQAFEKYAELVADYTHRKMSFSSDVLRALSGILPALNRAFALGVDPNKEAFRYGLPQSIIDVALLWQPTGELTRRKHCDEPQCKEPHMPSWSWAGWNGDVTYEPSFAVRTDDSGALVQSLQSNGLERMRPLVRFYAKGHSKLSEWPETKCTYLKARSTASISPPSKRLPPPPPPKNPSLNTSGAPNLPLKKTSFLGDIVPIGFLNGMGGPISRNMWTNEDRPSWLKEDALPWQWEGASQAPFSSPLSNRDVTAPKQYLVFQTQVARFRLGTTFELAILEKVQERAEESSPGLPDDVLRKIRPLNSLDIMTEANSGWTVRNQMEVTQILSSQGQEIGRVQIHDGLAQRGGGLCEFIVLSEAQYFGDEETVDTEGFPLYNVLLVEEMLGDTNVQARRRLGLGKMYKHAWKMASPVKDVIILG